MVKVIINDIVSKSSADSHHLASKIDDEVVELRLDREKVTFLLKIPNSFLKIPNSSQNERVSKN